MQDSPSARELILAVRDHLNRHLIPEIEEPALRFRTLVAANVLDVVAREMAMAGEQLPGEWQRLARLLDVSQQMPPDADRQGAEIEEMKARLCRQIEEGAFDDSPRWEALLEHCLESAREKLVIANPRFLQRVEASARGQE